MGFRFFRRIKIARGLTLNLSKSGGSLSVGRRGARYTMGSRGRRTTFGIPGTGLFYTTTSSGSSKKRKRGTGRRRKSNGDGYAPSAEEALTLGFFARLITPKGEEAFVDGCRELVRGNERGAMTKFSKSDRADAAFMGGVLSLKYGRFKDAIRCLDIARKRAGTLGCLFEKYGVTPNASLAVTDEVMVDIQADQRGVLLGLVEAYQRQGLSEDAMACLRHLRRLEPDDLVVRLSVVELLMEAGRSTPRVFQRIVELTEGVQNESAIHTALLLYKAKALRGLGLAAPARTALSLALRRKKNRTPELLRAVRYERALLYASIGQTKRARSDLELIYADAPKYEDVAQRLGFVSR